LRAAELSLQPAEGLRIVVVAIDVRSRDASLSKADWSYTPASFMLARARYQLVKPPPRLGDPDDGHVEAPPSHQGLKRGKDLLLGQIPCGSEENQGVGARCRVIHELCSFAFPAVLREIMPRN
jgi:hypothetical protein